MFPDEDAVGDLAIRRISTDAQSISATHFRRPPARRNEPDDVTQKLESSIISADRRNWMSVPASPTPMMHLLVTPTFSESIARAIFERSTGAVTRGCDLFGT
jgi:hypothetical protein